MMIDCLTNYAHEGATITETTFKLFLFDQNCPLGKSLLYTKQEHSTTSSVLKIVVLFIANMEISYTQ